MRSLTGHYYVLGVLPVLGVACAAVRLLRRLRALEAERASLVASLARSKADHDRQLKLRFEERTGRTNAEKKLRERTAMLPPSGSTTQSSGAAALSYTAIGRVASCYVERRGTPRQGCLVPSARAELKISSSVIQAAAALDGLEQFSHVWLIYDFHQNTNADKPQQQVRAKVHPPALGGAKLGLFATRTPHRPNAIGLTVAKLLGVRGDTLLLGGADLVDGTPVLDVKPYLRHDIQAEAIVPSWCEPVTASSLIREVQFSESAAAALTECLTRLRLYQDTTSLREAITETLLLDIRSVHQGRGEAADGQQYHVRLDRLDVSFETYERHVMVTDVQLRRA